MNKSYIDAFYFTMVGGKDHLIQEAYIAKGHVSKMVFHLFC